MSETFDFVFGTGKSNLFKKRKNVVTTFSDLDIKQNFKKLESESDYTEDIDLDEGGFDDCFYAEEGSSTSDILKSDIAESASFENSKAEIEISLISDLPFTSYLKGSKMLQGGYMKVK